MDEPSLPPLPTFETARATLLPHLAGLSKDHSDLQALAFLDCSRRAMTAARLAPTRELRQLHVFRARAHIRMARYWSRLVSS